MPVDPGTAYLIGQGVNALGGLLSQKKLDPKQALAEQQREFDAQQRFLQESGRTQDAFTQTDKLGAINRQMESGGARDKALFMLSQRLGMVPQQFRARDMMNPSTSPDTPEPGGIDPRIQQHAMESYHAPSAQGAGSGGVDPRVYQALMTKLGMQSGPAGPSVGSVQIEQPQVDWQRPANPRLQGIADQQAQQHRQNAPTGYNPGYQPPGIPKPNMDPGIVDGEWKRRTARSQAWSEQPSGGAMYGGRGF